MRKLRLGFVSPDFREHCQAMFTVPLLSHLDRDQFHVTAYSDVAMPDATTARIQGHVDVWRSIVGLSDSAVAELFRRDQIDILFDLTMHMAHNRLRMFALRPAPVQVSWLAYPGTTGLTAIDYRLSDPHLDPPGEADLAVYSERTVLLPETFWCYDPLTTDVEVNPLPALQARAGAAPAVTFGSLNNFVKVNEGVLELWGRVLLAVPGSRLLLLTQMGNHRDRLRQRFERQGIGPERVEFIGRQCRADYLRLYHRIDLGLDTFPYNGHTTSLDAMWMGVPVVTLAAAPVGRGMVAGRAGVCQLRNVGLTELIAWTPEEFVGIATGLAKDLDRLAEIRRTLRARMERSPLMDAARFARHMGEACRQMWQMSPDERTVG